MRERTFICVILLTLEAWLMEGCGEMERQEHILKLKQISAYLFSQMNNDEQEAIIAAMLKVRIDQKKKLPETWRWEIDA